MGGREEQTWYGAWGRSRSITRETSSLPGATGATSSELSDRPVNFTILCYDLHMLTIRREQMDALVAARWRDFVPVACDHCRTRHPETCSAMEEQQLRETVETGLRRARIYGFERASSLIRYLDFVLTLGPDFDRLPWVAEILALRQYQPEARLDLLSRTAAQQENPSETASDTAPSLPDASWPVPQPQPAPPPVVLEPPDETSMARPPLPG